jgi:hypothetical protein
VRKQVIALRRAAGYGHTDICQLVIDCATVSTRELTITLRAACNNRHLSVVQLIVITLGHHCNSLVLNDSLQLAALHCHTEVVKWILPLTHPTDDDYMRWDLILKSARGDLTRVTQLLVNKIGANVTDVMSHYLWTACYWGKVDIVDWLMTHTSADVNYSKVIYTNIGSMTSQAVACHEGHIAVVRRLLIDETIPCDVNIVTGKRCKTALHEVIWFTRETPLHSACYRGDTAIVVDVVCDCDVSMQDKKERLRCISLVQVAVLDTAKVLLSVFADTNITNDYGKTPVAQCEYGGSPELAHYIQHNHPISVSGDGDNNHMGVGRPPMFYNWSMACALTC